MHTLTHRFELLGCHARVCLGKADSWWTTKEQHNIKLSSFTHFIPFILHLVQYFNNDPLAVLVELKYQGNQDEYVLSLYLDQRDGRTVCPMSEGFPSQSVVVSLGKTLQP